MKKLTYLLILLAAISGAAVYAGNLNAINNNFVCLEDDEEWSDDEEDMSDEDEDMSDEEDESDEDEE
jgi:hypothetical protein